MDTDRNSSHDTHLHTHRSPGRISDPSSTIHSMPESHSNTTTNPILSIDHSSNTNPSPTSKTTANTPHLTPASSTSHLTPLPAKVTHKAMFRSSIEPVDASGEWLPAVAILGQTSSPAGSGENVGGSASAKQSEEGEAKDAWGVTTRTAKSGAQVMLGVPTLPQPQASTSTATTSSTAPAPAPIGKPRPPLMPSMARLRPASLDLSDSYPPDISDEGEGASSSDPLNASFSARAQNPRYSVSSNARYSLMSSPPETPLDASGLGVPLPPLPPRFMNMNMGGGGGDASLGSSALGGVGGMGEVGGSEGVIQPPPPTLTTGPTGYPAHVSVQLQDNGAATAPWHSYHLPRDTAPEQNNAPPAVATTTSTSAPQSTQSVPADTSDVPQPQPRPQATGQPWSYPAFQPTEYPPFSRGPRISASYHDPWGSHAPQNGIGNPWSAPAAYGPPRHATFSAQSRPPPHQAASAPIQGVRFASEPLNLEEAGVIQTGYEANDPFKRHTKPVQPTDDLTFDDIPIPGKHGLPHSWHLYEGPLPVGQQQPSSSANIVHAPSTYGPPTSQPPQPQTHQGPLEPPTRPWSYPTYSGSQPVGSAPSQSQPQPPPNGSASGSGPYLPIHSHNGSYQSYPYYPPHPASPAFGTWKKPSLWRRIFSPFKSTHKEDGDTQYDVLLPSNTGQGPVHYTTSPYATATPSWSSATTAIQFVFLTIPSQVYLSLLLRLPSLYFSRVARIFEEADLTLSELKKMALEIGAERAGASRKTDGEFSTRMQQMGLLDGFNAQGMGMEGAPKIPVAYERLKTTWEGFIDSVLREWKTFNIISVLLLSAILTILQIEEAAADPVTRHTALYSLVCALISLLFGCVYIIRFGTMRKAYKAAEWALEAKKSKTLIWWNVWILLAMPAIWLAWSLVLYVTCILSFVWRTGDPGSGPPVPLTQQGLLAVRIVLTVILGLGALYGSLIFSTFRRYGDAMDRKWKARIDGWIREKANESHYRPYSQPQSYPQHNSAPYYYPAFVSAPNEPNIRIPTTGPGASLYMPFQGPSHSRSTSQFAPSANDGWRSQAQQAHELQAASMRSSPIPTTRNVNESLKDYPPLRQPVMDNRKPAQDSADDEAPRYNYPEYQASLSTYGYTADAKAQYEYEAGRNSNEVMPASGLKEKMEIVQAPLPQTRHDPSNPSHPGLNKTIGSASSSTTTATQAPPYSSPSTSPTPPSYSSVPTYVTTHNLNNNPLRFNPPLKKNPQISMPPPPSLPTIPGTPLTIVTMKSFDSTAGAENYPMRGSPANDSMSASTSISNLQIDNSPRVSAVIQGLSPRAASKRPAGADESDTPASGVSTRSRSMSPQTPLLPSSLSAHSRPLSDISFGADRSSQGSRLAFERLPPGAAPPVRTSGEPYDAS